MITNLLLLSAVLLAALVLAVLWDWFRQEVMARYDAEPTYSCLRCHRIGADMYYRPSEASVISVLRAREEADTLDLIRRADLVLSGA